eukprot:6867120-Alexandrium_andersonii.AAC.1
MACVVETAAAQHGMVIDAFMAGISAASGVAGMALVALPSIPPIPLSWEDPGAVAGSGARRWPLQEKAGVPELV